MAKFFSFFLFFFLASQTLAGVVVSTGGGSFCQVLPKYQEEECLHRYEKIRKSKYSQFKYFKKIGIDNYRREFSLMALLGLQRLRLVAQIENKSEILPKSFVDDVEDLILSFQNENFKKSQNSFSLDHKLHDTNLGPLTAINIKEGQRAKIILNPFFWNAASYLYPRNYNGLVAKQVVALHEFLSLMGLEGSNNYTFSSQLVHQRLLAKNLFDIEVYKKMTVIAVSELACLKKNCVSGVHYRTPIQQLKTDSAYRNYPRSFFHHLAQYSSLPLPFIEDFMLQIREIASGRPWFWKHGLLSVEEIGTALYKALKNPSAIGQMVRTEIEKIEAEENMTCRYRRVSRRRFVRIDHKYKTRHYRFSCTQNDRYTESYWEVVLLKEFNGDLKHLWTAEYMP